MANEISIQFKLQGSKNGVVVTNNGSPATKTQNMESTLTVLHHTTQHVGTTVEDILLGDVSTAKEYWVLLINRDASNYVDARAYKDASNFADLFRLRPGEPFMARLKPQTSGYPKLSLIANTAPCDVEVIVIEAGDPAL